MEEVPIELQTGAFTRPGIRVISDWKTFNETLRENKEIRAKGLKKVAHVHQFRSRAGNVKKLQEGTRTRFAKFIEEKKPSALDEDVDAEHNVDEMRKALYRDDDLKSIRCYIAAPSSRYHVALFDKFEDLGSALNTARSESTMDSFDTQGIAMNSETISCLQSVVDGMSSFSSNKTDRKQSKLGSRRASVKSVKAPSSTAASSRLVLPNIEKSRTDKYFGSSARTLFYETYHEIGRKVNIFQGGCEDMDQMINTVDNENAMKLAMASLMESGVLTPPQSPRSKFSGSPSVMSTSKRPKDGAISGADSSNSPMVPSLNDASIAGTSSSIVAPPLKLPLAVQPLTSIASGSSAMSSPSRYGVKKVGGESFLIGSRSLPKPSTASRAATSSRISSRLDSGIAEMSISSATIATDLDRKQTSRAPSELALKSQRSTPVGLALGGHDSIFDDDGSLQEIGSMPGWLAGSTSAVDAPSLTNKSSRGKALSSRGDAEMEPLLVSDISKEMKEYLDSMSESTYGLSSPRATFLNGCIQHNLPPRAVAILRRNLSSKLNLAHIGLGDVLGILLAKSLAEIPALVSLNLEDNNLTDPGLTAILNSLSGNPQLEELNIGMNKIDDEAAEALRNYIGNPDCLLRSLHLKQADIDDGECAEFVAALMNNRHLEELVLSNNMLGKDENLNAIYPDLVTGGESLAELIEAGNCPLRILILSWNMIRLGGANDLCGSIRHSNTLQHLDLSYNALGQEASSILGSALLENKVLTHLILSNNGIDEIGAFTLAVGMRENKVLQVVNLDGNPIGEQGGLMLMRVAIFCGSRLKFSALSCDLKVTSPATILRFQDPTRSYNLSMDNCYHRAVAYAILDLVCEDVNLAFSTSTKESKTNLIEYYSAADPRTANKLELVMVDEPQSLDSDEYAEVEMLTDMIEKTKSSDSIVKLFKKFDEDGSGGLDCEELQSLLEILGIEAELDKVKGIISAIDIDGKGTIDVDELVNYVTHIRINGEQRLQDMKMKHRFSVNGQQQRLIPWTEGRMSATINFAFGQPMHHRALSLTQVLQVLDQAEDTSNPERMIQFSLEGAKLHLTEAQYMLDGLNQISDNGVEALQKILPGMMTIIEAQQLLKIGIGSDVKMLRMLKRNLGSTYFPLLGYFSGYYRLDMMKTNDRKCLFMLLQRSASFSQIREKNGLGDLSQHGDFTCFRNTNWYCKQVRKLGEKISLEQFFPIPERGVLEFDFVDWEKPNIHLDRPMADDKVLRMLTTCRLIKNEKYLARAQRLLAEMKISAKLTIRESGYRYWKPDQARSLAVAEHLNELYNHKSRGYEKRHSSLRKSSKREKIGEKKDDTLGSDSESEGEGEGEGEGDGEDIVEGAVDVEGEVGEGEAGEGDGDEDIEGGAGEREDSISGLRSDSLESEKPGVAISSPVATFKKQMSIESTKRKGDDTQSRHRPQAPNAKSAVAAESTMGAVSYLRRQQREFDALFASKRATSENKSFIVLEFLESSLLGRRLYCRQLAVIIQFFKTGRISKSNMGSYRVELVVSAFHRLLDLNNFEMVLMVLTAKEHACVIARLGWLAVFNPCKPEGYYELDLTRWEERQIFKMLVHLAARENAGAIVDVAYMYERGYIPTPGFEITPQFAYASEGIKPQGQIRFEFTSGDGVGLNGQRPNLSQRNTLIPLVLLSNEEITLEEHMFEDDAETIAALSPIGFKRGVSVKTKEKVRNELFHTLLEEIGRTKATVSDANESLKSSDPNVPNIDWHYWQK